MRAIRGSVIVLLPCDVSGHDATPAEAPAGTHRTGHRESSSEENQRRGDEPDAGRAPVRRLTQYGRREPSHVNGGVDPRINGEQRVSEATRCRAGHQEVASRQAASRLLRCAPALRVTCRNLLIRLAFMAGSELPAITGPFARTCRSRMSTPISCVRQIPAVLRSHQHPTAGTASRRGTRLSSDVIMPISA